MKSQRSGTNSSLFKLKNMLHYTLKNFIGRKRKQKYRTSYTLPYGMGSSTGKKLTKSIFVARKYLSHDDWDFQPSFDIIFSLVAPCHHSSKDNINGTLNGILMESVDQATSADLRQKHVVLDKISYY